MSCNIVATTNFKIHNLNHTFYHQRMQKENIALLQQVLGVLTKMAMYQRQILIAKLCHV